MLHCGKHVSSVLYTLVLCANNNLTLSTENALKPTPKSGAFSPDKGTPLQHTQVKSSPLQAFMLYCICYCHLQNLCCSTFHFSEINPQLANLKSHFSEFVVRRTFLDL